MTLDISQNKMKEIRVNIAHHRREFYSSVPVNSIGYVDNEHLNKFQLRPNLLQIGIRLCSSLPSIHNTLDGEKYENNFPHVVIKMPGVACCVEEDVYAKVLYFTYNKSLCTEFESRHMLSDCLAWNINLSSSIHCMVDELSCLIENISQYGNADRIDQLAFMLFQELILCKNSVNVDQNSVEARLARIDSYLHAHFKENVDFENLACSIGMSRRTLFRYWKKYYKKTPGEYMRDLKMENAKFLLVESSKTIEEISENVNIGYVYFCAIFKKHCGMTPLQFRNKNRFFTKIYTKRKK
jgi:AraC-like DNA-binding protein